MANRRKDDELKELMKEAWKETAREWLDEKYALVGKWTIRGLAASILSLIGYLIILVYGQHLVSYLAVATPFHGVPSEHLNANFH